MASLATDRKKHLVYNVIHFLRTSLTDGSVREDDREGLEVAVQCIGEAFGVDPDDEAQKRQYSIEPATLQSLFNVYLKTQQSLKEKKTPQTGESSSSFQPTSANPIVEPTPEQKANAEKLKAEGNALMAQKTQAAYQSAIDKYTEAISLDSRNPVYYSNRAAAYSQANQHDLAINDAQKALEVDPSFSKAYSRLGHAYFCTQSFKESVKAYEDGLALEPNNPTMKASLATAKARLTAQELSDEGHDQEGAGQNTARSAGAGAADGAGFPGMGGGPGGFDLGSLMNNPAIMNMASQLMANGGMDSLLNNPAMRDMANRVQSGGGMPSVAEMMQNPALRDLAGNFMGGGAGGAGGAGRGAGRGNAGSGANDDMYS